MNTNRGFTLIELLVALAIVSLVAVLSWQGLDNVIRLTQRVRQSDDQWEQMRAALAQLERDLKAVNNPRNTTGFSGNPQGNNPGSNPGNAGSPEGTAAGAPGRQRSADRTDVIVENDDNLDAVVNTALANTQRVQVRNTALEIIASQSNLREGPTTAQIRWQLVNNQWRRDQINLTQRPDGVPDPAMAARNANPAQAALFDEPGLTVRGVGIRLWIEGRGWDTEQSLGNPLPPEQVQSMLGNATPGAAAGSPASTTGNPPGLNSAANPANPANPLRIKGVQIRLWLPSGDIYTRVFMLGQES